MDDSLKNEGMAGDAGIDPEKIDFTLDEKELENMSGGFPADCGEIGLLIPQCTGTGV